MNQNQIEKNKTKKKNSSEEHNHSTISLEFTQDFYSTFYKNI